MNEQQKALLNQIQQHAQSLIVQGYDGLLVIEDLQGKYAGKLTEEFSKEELMRNFSDVELLAAYYEKNKETIKRKNKEYKQNVHKEKNKKLVLIKLMLILQQKNFTNL